MSPLLCSAHTRGNSTVFSVFPRSRWSLPQPLNLSPARARFQSSNHFHVISCLPSNPSPHFSLKVGLFWVFHVKRNPLVCVFFLTNFFNFLLSRSAHEVVWNHTSSLFYGWVIFHCVNRSLFIDLLICGWASGFFPALETVNNTTIHTQVSVWTSLHFSGIYLGVGGLSHTRVCV